ncbi:GtrA family protein [Pseudomonas protegens]|jgi:putative flippase GtrA|uniref:GtrA family protein n=2 Tax=Pseudomonas protegens TaxID=380021 RepID=Q4K5C9_PSEF5|nr:GtrA family protein [Pseudomonas protegens]AAY94696.1 GtrA family protein [Pseudomonas protegens Pf-5]ASE21154.1 GtrA family protein [Pseudomonas protegens]PNV96695.1 GtrA family protein [Pseudomonas protegens]QEZ49283.1 GtrA family protein [Pseudomonas protegens]QEZ58627.1 GtrA family protein [Pseudomonas protegens]
MQFVRYLVIQVLAYGLDMGGFVLLFSHFGVDPLLANVICKLLAGVFAFIAHRSFTFGVVETAGRLQQAVRYFALLALNIPLSALVLSGMLWLIPMAIAAKFVADVICVFLNYGLSKRYVFQGESASQTKVVDDRSEQ